MSERKLNKAQKQAVEHNDGPLLIVAGAGTGKTTVITTKICHLIEKGLAKPEEILALTFTDKAAEEMQIRLDEMIEIGYTDIQISTFHAFCQKILEQHAIDIGLSNQFKLVTETAAWLLIRQNFAKFDLDYYRPMGNPTKHIHELLKHFSKCKDELIAPEDYLAYGEGLTDETPEKEEEKKRFAELANAYRTYNQLLIDNAMFDFGDLIFYTHKIFSTRPAVLQKLKKQYKYVLVDEFQDVNYSQYELVKMLSDDNSRLTVVGDDDQCLPGNTLIATTKGDCRIDRIKKGDLVFSAIGKGHHTSSTVLAVKKTKKQATLVRVETEGGRKLELTDNHLVFSYTPQKSDNKYFYVYLMQRQGWGWRMGITSDLSVRLRLERGADRIIAIKTFDTESEARFYETVYSLKYNIPTVCFKERGGFQNNGWLKKIFEAIDTEANVRILAQELNIDLHSHHYCLGGVTRGASRRVKINVVMCYRNYRSKTHKNNGVQHPSISHLLHIETSNRIAIDILRQSGIVVGMAKKGKRFRVQSSDLLFIETLAKKLAAATGGIIDYKFNLAQSHNHTIDCRLMPAKNLRVGLYVPIFDAKKGIIVDRIKNISYTQKKQFVYDLEINKTHNYIANGIVVHNSIYAFRGASVSNIMRFKDDFPKAKEVVLNENYRSNQAILDLAYESIQNNNPDRLEVKLKLDKRLVSKALKQNNDTAVVHLHEATLDDEVQSVVREIFRLKQIDETVTWDDFAILVRANNHAEPFLSELQRQAIPYEFLSSSGLYRLPIIVDCLNFLKVMVDHKESPAVYRLLCLEFLKVRINDLHAITFMAKKKSMPYYAIIKNPDEYGLSQEGSAVCRKLLTALENGMRSSKTKKPYQLIVNFLEEIGYFKYLIEGERDGNETAIKKIYHLTEFLKYIKEYETISPDANVADFLDHFMSVGESGDKGSLYQPSDTPDSVNVLTIHGSKGLEFKYVFVVNCAEERFPSRAKSSGIEIPTDLVKEQLPEGDSHYQEERRLFYVAVTRAKERLYFSSASSYGGARAKKISRFLAELKFAANAKEIIKKVAVPEAAVEKDETTGEFTYTLPKAFSFSQLRSYETCPYQYKLAHILHIPTKGSASFSFGQTMHATLQAFYIRLQELNSVKQVSLFDQAPVKSSDTTTAVATGVKAPPLEELLKIYDGSWLPDWYKSEHQREEYYDKGKDILRLFYKSHEGNWTIPVNLESWFKIKVGKYLVHGRIDRIDQLPDGSLEIIDYKTGKSKDRLTSDDKEQLLIYQIATQELPEYHHIGKPSKLTFYYVNDNLQSSFIGEDKELEKLREKLVGTIDKIHLKDFTATPGQFACEYCDFKDICDYRV